MRFAQLMQMWKISRRSSLLDKMNTPLIIREARHVEHLIIMVMPLVVHTQDNSTATSVAPQTFSPTRRAKMTTAASRQLHRIMATMMSLKSSYSRTATGHSLLKHSARVVISPINNPTNFSAEVDRISRMTTKVKVRTMAQSLQIT